MPVPGRACEVAAVAVAGMLEPKSTVAILLHNGQAPAIDRFRVEPVDLGKTVVHVGNRATDFKRRTLCYWRSWLNSQTGWSCARSKSTKKMRAK